MSDTLEGITMPPDVDFSATVENAARELVSVEFHNGSAFIRTPILYPSGSTVVVRVDDNGKSYFVSDFGMGYQEADLMEASLIYGRHARTIAEMAGIRFDSEAFFVIEVSREQLAGAIATIANCSQEAVALAATSVAAAHCLFAARDAYLRARGSNQPHR
jgi:hypothetical protein